MPSSTYPAEFFRDSNTKRRMGYCFVLMPFDPAMNEVFDTVRDALEGEPWKFECRRADDFFAGGHILSDILRGIQEAQIVIADLTGRNPNVFYELGIAHMVKQPNEIILLTQNIASVPFDLQSFRCIQYAQTIQGAKRLRDDLGRALGEVAERVYRFDVKQGTEYQFSNRLFGDNDCIYDFSLSAEFVGVNAVKGSLQVRRYVVGATAPENIYDDTYAIKRGGRIKVPAIPWELRLDRLDGDSSAFSLAHVDRSDGNRSASVGNMTAAELQAIIVGALSLAAAKKQTEGVAVDEDPQAVKSLAASVAEGALESQDARATGVSEWKHHVLWVDDRPQNNVLERRAFEALGITFTLATSTSEALQHFKDSRFGAIISDMGRKEGPLEGYVLLDVLRRRGDQTPFFIYTGSNSPVHKLETFERRGQGSTNNAQELFEMVRRALLT